MQSVQAAAAMICPALTCSHPSYLCRACYGVLRFIMESGAKGCEVIVSGKLRAQRAKAMKFKDGYMVSSGNPTRDYIDGAIRHVLLRQGVLGIKVRFGTYCVSLLAVLNSPECPAACWYVPESQQCRSPAVPAEPMPLAG